jgi:hypothetical protein
MISRAKNGDAEKGRALLKGQVRDRKKKSQKEEKNQDVRQVYWDKETNLIPIYLGHNYSR